MILLANWSHVWMVTGLGFLMVIALLVVLIFILKLLGTVISGAVKAPAKASAPKADAPAFNGVHDVEPTEIHIKRVERSGWNSKLYGMNNLHR